MEYWAIFLQLLLQINTFWPPLGVLVFGKSTVVLFAVSVANRILADM